MKNEEKEIRAVIEKELINTQEKNVNELMPGYLADCILFDVVNPLQYKGANGAKQRMKDWFDTFDGPIKINIHNLRISAEASVGFGYCLKHVHGIKIDGTTLDMWWRETTCYTKIGDTWAITHRHSSVPFNTEDGKASMGLKPDDIDREV